MARLDLPASIPVRIDTTKFILDTVARDKAVAIVPYANPEDPMEPETTQPNPRAPIRRSVLQVVNAMVDLLEPLSDEDRSFAMRMAAEMATVAMAPNAGTLRPSARNAPTVAPANSPSERALAPAGSVQAAVEQCEHLGEFFALCGSPESGAEKVLVAAAFMQTKAPNEDGGFGTRQLNNALKHLGQAVANATVTLERLTDRRPQPIIVLKKGGKSVQAHKSYKMTPVGFDEVGRMLAGGGA
ncbi:MAG: hypothetical protein MUC36_18220 [Planctomycetes bacterium]|jgi:hypothetical protein|nr:hypothetical protein [Planctomycetota bacterium]